MAKEDTPKYAKGFRFHPFDRELITDYLKPKIMGTQLPCNMIKFKEVYGPSSNAWRVFDTNDRDSWFRTPGLKKTEKCMFVFVERKLSRLNSNTSKRAGCGTWLAQKKPDSIVDCEGNVIGEKRYLVFEINDLDSVEAGFDLSRVGQFKMHEYSLSGVNAGLNSAASIVLCRITYDSSKQCPLNLKPGARSAIVVSSISEAQNKEEENTNNFEGSGIVETENLTLLDSGGENLEESRTLTSKDLAVIDSGVGCNLEEGTGIVKTENLTLLDSGVIVGENLEESRTLTSKDLAVIDCVVAGNLEGSRTLTSESLVVISNDVNDPYAAAQYNNGLQESDAFGGGFHFGDLGGQDFCLDGLDDGIKKWFMACLDPNVQEEPSLDSSRINLKREFEYEDDDLYQFKKICLDNPN